MAANPTNIQQWFAKYLAVLEQFNIQSLEQIWSGDNTGIQNVPAFSKVEMHLFDIKLPFFYFWDLDLN